MDNVGNAFALPFKSPNWFATFLLIGLIFLIPIVGWINLLGWMLATLDIYRQGRAELPPAGFQYIGRGINVFVVWLVYALVTALVLIVPFTLIAIAVGAAAANNSSAVGVAFGGLAPLWGVFALVLGVVVYVALPAVIVHTERGGIGGGLNIGGVYRTIAADWKNSLLAGLLIYVAYFIGGLGIYACCVGILLTYPYATSVVAGVIRYYEATFESTPSAPPQPPPPVQPPISPA